MESRIPFEESRRRVKNHVEYMKNRRSAWMLANALWRRFAEEEKISGIKFDTGREVLDLFDIAGENDKFMAALDGIINDGRGILNTLGIDAQTRFQTKHKKDAAEGIRELLMLGSDPEREQMEGRIVQPKKTIGNTTYVDTAAFFHVGTKEEFETLLQKSERSADILQTMTGTRSHLWKLYADFLRGELQAVLAARVEREAKLKRDLVVVQ